MQCCCSSQAVSYYERLYAAISSHHIHVELLAIGRVSVQGVVDYDLSARVVYGEGNWYAVIYKEVDNLTIERAVVISGL